MLNSMREDVRILDTEFLSPALRARRMKMEFLSPDHYRVSTGTISITGVVDSPIQLGDLRFRVVTEEVPRLGKIYDVLVLRPSGAAAMARGSLVISSPRSRYSGNVSVVSIQFTSASPWRAKLFVDALIEAYLEQQLDWKTESAASVERFVQERINLLERNVSEAEENLAEFKATSGMVELSHGAQALVEQLSEQEAAQARARTELSMLQQAHAALSRADPPVEAFLVGDAQDPMLGRLGAEFVAAVQEHKVMQGQFTPESVEVQTQARVVESAKRAISDYIGAKMRQVKTRLVALNRLTKKFEDRYKTCLRRSDSLLA